MTRIKVEQEIIFDLPEGGFQVDSYEKLSGNVIVFYGDMDEKRAEIHVIFEENVEGMCQEELFSAPWGEYDIYYGQF